MRTDTDRIVRYEEYVAGWLDSSIGDFLAHFPQNPKRMNFALITALDSDLAPSKLLDGSPELRSIAGEAKPLGSGFLVPTSLLLEAVARQTLFYGFDEVWFFPHDDICPKPPTAWLVGPNRVDQTKLDRLGPWIVDNECALALGDGGGLNFIAKARGLARYLLAYSLSQPQPATSGEEEVAKVR